MSEGAKFSEPAVKDEAIDDLGVQSPRSLAEWLTLAITTAVLVTVIGLVIYDWQVSRDRPPAFQITTESVRFTDSRYYVPFTIQNTGGQIVRAVQVRARLHLAEADDEAGEQQIDFLSASERKQGSFVFDHDPHTGELTIRVASFALP
ncbi:TIGR02588 family protein [Romeria aff. gracilis LEGE 07310]|uniref:TIGR02588 family protein n=1 Tax=Vasconcelosia minhoensis LEGE 07310 TaxID=915328 RepID=A0A8J7A9D5_9CYAN|nr:TIGR02588 family protein [Romeria gracilis]MBE9078550.1 TIGR02588 family protein [Romeria aff. gracilis LEGE 07310]